MHDFTRFLLAYCMPTLALLVGILSALLTFILNVDLLLHGDAFVFDLVIGLSTFTLLCVMFGLILLLLLKIKRPTNSNLCDVIAVESIGRFKTMLDTRNSDHLLEMSLYESVKRGRIFDTYVDGVILKHVDVLSYNPAQIYAKFLEAFSVEESEKHQLFNINFHDMFDAHYEILKAKAQQNSRKILVRNSIYSSLAFLFYLSMLFSAIWMARLM
ncbi:MULTISPECIES: hypothetical protein [Vibrio]|uniref:Uncharacterized protein n=1 Tax=Vibrio splendidus TaxID=29497 RepID=A0A2N7JXC6_VIBSP|nr:hypothetical protein [Vibrio splendidus]PMM64846.1 hypothetical protein BCT54_17280 [Vibrio splendidus]